jgi:hypothetical protein
MSLNCPEWCVNSKGSGRITCQTTGMAIAAIASPMACHFVKPNDIAKTSTAVTPTMRARFRAIKALPNLDPHCWWAGTSSFFVAPKIHGMTP